MENTTMKTNNENHSFMEDDTPITAMSAARDEKLIECVTTNLSNLINMYNMTQAQLSEATGYAASTVNKYFNGKMLPPIDFFFKLQKLYDISIDDFISRPILEPAPKPDEGRLARELEELKLGRKYCGTYIVYYLDTSKYKGRDHSLASESLVYGVLRIKEVETIDMPEFKCKAIFGIHSRKKAHQIKDRLDNGESFNKIAAEVSPDTEYNNIYKGTFEFGARHVYIHLKHGTQDQAFLVLYRIESNKPIFNGGLASINSSSKGRESMPTYQFIGISRFPLSLSPEEIHHELLLSYPTLKADAEIKDLISMFKNTYLLDKNDTSIYTEYQKELMARAYLEDTIKKIITKNTERYAKISTRDDDGWYHLVKAEAKKINGVKDSDDEFDY